MSYVRGGGQRFSNCTTSLKGDFNCYNPGFTTAGNIGFQPGTLRPLDSVVYYVRPDANGNTLYRKRAGSVNAEPIIDGIEQMTVHYGIDTDANGVANRFIRAGNLQFRHSDWDRVDGHQNSPSDPKPD